MFVFVDFVHAWTEEHIRCLHLLPCYLTLIKPDATFYFSVRVKSARLGGPPITSTEVPNHGISGIYDHACVSIGAENLANIALNYLSF